jgi:hypothetical protein
MNEIDNKESDKDYQMHEKMFGSAWSRPCVNYLFSIKIPRIVKKKLNIKAPYALSGCDWMEYESWLKENHPFVWWFEHKFMDKVQDLFCYAPKHLSAIKYYLKNRFIRETHNLQTNLKKGEYHEIDNRIIHGLFNTLVIFVEVEVANFHKKLNRDKKEYAGFNNVDHAMAYFKFQIEQSEVVESHKNEHQEIIDLYEWWTKTRPSRVDPFEAFPTDKDYLPGWCDKDISDEEKEENYKRYESIAALEKEYQQEDEDMMIRLIKVRQWMWT